jgi:8-oxo-dGTP diphosphatase
MQEAKFCPHCGTPMQTRQAQRRMRPVCPACGYVHYVNPIVAAGALVDQEGSVLLVRRNVPPGLGAWALPAGYAEIGEMPEQAAIRETLEETGVQIALDGLLDIYPFGDDVLPSGVLLIYTAHPIGGELVPGDDAMEARYFPPDALPIEMAFRTHRQALARWVRGLSIVYRLATPSNLPALAELSDAASIELTASWDELLADAQAAVIIALADDRVVGLVVLSRAALADTTSLGRIYVSPGYRRWGIATRLVREARAQARTWSTGRLLAEVASNDRSLSFFLQAGFQVCGFRQEGPTATLFLCENVYGELPAS